LRAALGSGSVLTSVYAGFPHSFFHHMALGETIGFGIRLSQNEKGDIYSVTNQGMNEVHIALMGDPTLRLHPVVAPSELTATPSGTGVELRWNASADSEILGYAIYRAKAQEGPFTKVSGNDPVQGTIFRDSPPAGTWAYMVRAVKRETSASGTYLNMSQGVFASATAQGGEIKPASPITIQRIGLESGRVKLSFTAAENQEFVVESAPTPSGPWHSASSQVLRGPEATFSEIVASGEGKLFYRARQL